MPKLRVHEVAKEFNVPSKEIIELLKDKFSVEKKHMTSLTDEELKYVNEHYGRSASAPVISTEKVSAKKAVASEKKAKAPTANAEKPEKVNAAGANKVTQSGAITAVPSKPATTAPATPRANKAASVEASTEIKSADSGKTVSSRKSAGVASRSEKTVLESSSNKTSGRGTRSLSGTTAAVSAADEKTSQPAPKNIGARNDSASSPRPSFGARNDSASSPRPSFGARSDSASSPRTGFGARTDSTNSPRPSFGARNDSASSPRPGFGARNDSTNSPRPSFGAKNDSANSPRTGFGARTDSTNSARPGFGARTDSASSPRSGSGARTDSASSPRPSFGARQDSTGGQRGGFGGRSGYGAQKTNAAPHTKKVSQKSSIVNSIKSGATSGAKPSGRIIDTRSAVVDIERYNEKYDNLAFDKMDKENTVQKQKITQKSQQRRNRGKSAKRETEAERLKRIAQERKVKQLTVLIPDEITVGELALRLKATAAEVIKKLMLMGTMATINDTIDFDTASLVAMELHAKVEKEVIVTIEERIIDDSDDADENLQARPPVVVVMGHVDHGKTSLLDAIRKTDVIATEAGGITQHIGAYTVNLNGKDITFLDTPGHEAFTTMRARGAQVTDIAILVVAADDGIMPQTIEAINHAKAANVSIITAINKMDKPGANPEQVKQQLTEHGIVPEEWGGDVPCIPISAKNKQGIEEVLEMVNLIAEMKELKANPDRAARGAVIDAKLDKGRGPVATVLVQNGTLNVGDIVVAGTAVGRVRAMLNDKGKKVKSAGPSMPVEITGLDSVPQGGDTFNAVSDEKLARELVEQRRAKIKEDIFNSQTKVTLDNLFDQMQLGEVKELKIIVKADVQGSVEAVRQSLERISNEEVRVNVIHGAVGAISESDVMLANASNAIIVGFNVRPEPSAAVNAERSGVDMRLYRVIYTCIDEITAAMKGMLAPKFREVQLGRAECRQVYKASNIGTIAGCYVLDGKVTRNAQIRVVRDGIVITEDSIVSLKRFKDDAKEVTQGFECGIKLDKFNDIKEGDIFEAFMMEEYRD